MVSRKRVSDALFSKYIQYFRIFDVFIHLMLYASLIAADMPFVDPLLRLFSLLKIRDTLWQ
ncbi:hypothetical protein AU489_13505 [Lonsdalea populi]|uniref:Uncharacterized protein n=2 Tax=Lonsdalea TaxID=1082702 RepID=A0ACD1JBY8_9GAMM|nr:hypothetical protein AU485_09295 [Lonsdalea quercina]RAT17941.1 hypothetical protein AU487_15010 [Lonsdalea populi]RAT22101.1 hypothetical protein AU489_13505 [Lonsdalea populi]RAT24040.1 hypothetical protein AU488_08885 [Lonsdalea populi]RAT33912.1 hypothetical protein AU492_09680 [Lonsdalea populi]